MENFILQMSQHNICKLKRLMFCKLILVSKHHKHNLNLHACFENIFYCLCHTFLVLEVWSVKYVKIL